MKLKLFTFLLAVMTSIGAVFAESGTCGDNLTWELTEDGVLTINGTGVMKDYSSYHDCPWPHQSVKEVIINDGVTTIGSSAFYNCSNLISATIPESVVTIRGHSFYNCTNLISITIPESVEVIESDAFYGVANINYTGQARDENGGAWGALKLNNEYATIDLSVIRSIAKEYSTSGYYLFGGVISSIDEINTVYGNATFTITDGNVSFLCYRMKDYFNLLFTDSEQLSVGDSVIIYSKLKKYNNTPEAVEGYLIYNSRYPIFSPDNQTYYAPINEQELKLYKASNCDTLDIPEYITNNGIIRRVTEIAYGAIYDLDSIKCVVLPRTLKYMPNAFNECDNIQTLYYNAENLEKPKTIPFAKNALTLQNVYVGEYVASIPDEFFNNFENITTVEWNAKACADFVYSPFYYSRHSIQNFTINNEIEVIPNSLCYQITAVKDYTIPSTVKHIGNDAFNGTEISEVKISSNVQTVGSRAFANCPLTKVYWDVKDQNDYSVESAGNGAIIVSLDASNLNWDKVNLYAWTSSGESIKKWPGIEITEDENGLYTYTFPSKYSTINIIWNNGTDQSVDIENVSSPTLYKLTGSTGIDISYTSSPIEGESMSPFTKSTVGIEEFVLGNNVSHIPAQLCRNMKSLQVIDIPSSVTSIGKAAFKGCENLTKLTLSENISTYGDEAFAKCSALSSIYNYRERPAKLGSNTFGDVDYFNCTLYVLAGSVDMYKSNSSDWKDFYFIEPIGSETTQTDQIVITPSDYSVNVKWPVVANATSYQLTIYDMEGNIVCTLSFNANGQLTNIDFSSPAKAPQHTQSAGFSFTVSGLEQATQYSFTLTAMDEDGNIIDSQQGSFSTTLDGMTVNTNDLEIKTNASPRKVFENGNIHILMPDGRRFSATGQEIL